MTAIELRFLFLLAGFPSIAYLKTFSLSDRRVAEQIVAHLGWLPDAEDRELEDVLEDELAKDKYQQEWGS